MTNSRPINEMEAKWQKRWQEQGTYRAEDAGTAEKYYGLIEFPYPSGEGLHVGHSRSFTAIDIVTRKRRMEGKNVLYPIGWDAFGLPTENFAIKHKVKPQDATAKNVANSKRQLQMQGIGFDWSREINTTDPAYFKWTQWQFLQFFKHGMAYKSSATINWCPRCKIGLANEEAQGGTCERCGNAVEKREKAQWMIAITKYAERLIQDLDLVDYLPQVKTQQINWIGKSEGAYVDFAVAGTKNAQDKVTVFTTRPDTLFGATYLVLAPEHPLVETWLNEGDAKNPEAIRRYREEAAQKTEMERTADEKEKTGAKLEGITAVNPANGEKIPVWISDYVLATYGTGAIMAVPAHDERDFAFAKKFDLPIKQVIAPVFVDETNPHRDEKKTVSRRTVQCLLHDPKRNAFACLAWKQFDWKTFIVGGMEAGESPEDAAVREVREETGYQHVRAVRTLGKELIAKYFAAHKDENRTAIVTGVLLELEDDVKKDVAAEETAKHEMIWIPADQVMDFVRGAELAVLWQQVQKPTDEAFTGEGENIHSDFLDGLPTWKAKADMISWLEEQKKGERATTYRLRDWVFSRQRYWGEPIPIIHCPKDGFVPVPDEQLPVLLPDVDAYEPTDSGESPLANIREWVEVACPKCGGKAERETDTMPNWAGSSWYFLRYGDPHNEQELASKENLKYWLPVDLYNGGMEHTTLHLLYSRFWYKFLWDIGVVPKECGAEPYAKRRSHGLILAEGGEKMSKSKGNVVNPDDVVGKYGADVFRLYMMFMGPYDQPVPWDTNGIEGVRRFLDKVWNLFESKKIDNASELDTLYHQTVKKVSEGIEQMQFNTCVSQMMILTNAYQDAGGIPEAHREGYLKILAPFAPHLAEELWEMAGNKTSIHRSAWPAFDADKLKAETFALVIQVNGKLRDKIIVASDISEADAKAAALASEKVQAILAGKAPKQVIYVAGRLVSVVV